MAGCTRFASIKVGAVAGAAAVLAGVAGAQPVEWRTVAASGQSAPGLSGVTFENLTDGRITPDGGVAAFRATLAGAGVTGDTDGSIWVVQGGGPAELRYREGMDAPGTHSVLTGIASVDLAPDGLVGFAAGLYEGTPASTVTNVAYYVETGQGVLGLVTREALGAFVLGTHIPMNTAHTLGWNEPTAVKTTNGTVASTATAWGGAGSVLRVFSPAALGPDSDLVFRAGFGANTTTSQWRYGLFTSAGELLTRAETGGPVAGMNAAWVEVGTSPVVGPGGRVAVWGRVVRAGETTPVAGLFYGENAALSPLVVAGDAAAGLGGAVFGGFDPQIAMMEDGRVVFNARLAGAGVTAGVDNGGVFIVGPGQPARLLARRGEALLGMPEGSGLRLAMPPMAQGGIVAFLGTMSGASGATEVLIAGDVRVRPRVVVRSGEVLTLPGVGTKTVRAIAMHSEPAFTGRSQMAGRELLVKLGFTDGTHGLFVAGLACLADFDGDGDVGTDEDVEAFFACLGGNCCGACGPADFNGDGDVGTDADIEAFFAAMGGGC